MFFYYLPKFPTTKTPQDYRIQNQQFRFFPTFIGLEYLFVTPHPLK